MWDGVKINSSAWLYGNEGQRNRNKRYTRPRRNRIGGGDTPEGRGRAGKEGAWL